MAIGGSKTNTLIEALEPDIKARFSLHFTRVELQRGDVLHNPGQLVDRIHFPLTGLVAISSETIAGESVQTAMIGCDGAVGAFEALGSGRYMSRGVVQIAGVALRLGAMRFRDLLDKSPGLQEAMERYVEMVVTEARQLIACTALHAIEGRLSRSILDATDRGCLDRILPLTQNMLAHMLGAQRSTIATCISKLQREGLIKSGRGAIEILSRTGLERSACSCHETLRLAREEIFASSERERQRSFG